jgi:AraC-like DNA-binding protein
MSLSSIRIDGLKKRDMLKRKVESPRGVLHIGPGEPLLGLERFEPGQGLCPFIEHYWAVTWKRQPRTTRETVPHPCVHLVLEPGRSELHGVYLRRFTRIIEGSGRVLGVKFRPGGFRTFAKESVARLTGKIVHPSTILGRSIQRLEADATSCAEAGEAFRFVDAFLTRFDPTSTSELITVTNIVESIVNDRSITRVELLVPRFGLGLRQLQRIFREYVGVGPKWVIQRYRLIEAAERIRNRAESVDFAGLAFDLGYADQAHFIRDFKKLVGTPPAEYQKTLLL